MKKLYLIALFFVISVPVFAGEKEVAIDDGTAKFRALYEKGFALVMEMLPADITDPKLKPLSDLKRFKEKYVGWARLGEKRYFAIGDGFANGAWLAVIPPDHPLIRVQTHTLLIEPNSNINVLRIRPDDITEVWAGIVLVHELSHLADRVTKFEPPNPTREQYLYGEARAYELELRASNLVSRGAFSRQLDIMLDTQESPSIESLVNKLMGLNYSDVSDLDSVVTSEKPKSDAERRLRLGFYSIALFFRAVEKSKDKETFLRGLNRLHLRADWSDDPYKW